jgi:hypothetical protein
MISTGRKVCWCSETIVRSSPEPPLNVGTMTLTEALPEGILSIRLDTPNKARDTCGERIVEITEVIGKEGLNNGEIGMKRGFEKITLAIDLDTLLSALDRRADTSLGQDTPQALH